MPARLPIPDLDSQPFWQACREQRLIAQECEKCHEMRLPPSPACPRCRSVDYHWVDLTGRGTVWTFTVVHHAFHPSLAEEVPYVVGLISLNEGPRLVGRIKARAEDVQIGGRVRVRFEDLDETRLPYFELET